ncbi:MAG: GxGYxYP family putative glycoside hydrolase, partial [Armatimonadota bacterium]|nr:GxGYxYP family putative glycoside hydrolase [Armatimonadota bacterium]
MRERMSEITIIAAIAFCVICWAKNLEQSNRLPESVMREVIDQNSVPKGTYQLVAEWEAERDFAHRIGRKVEDTEASNNAAWEVRVGEDQPNAHALFGPYADVVAGDYVAFFRIKLLDEPVRDYAVEIDACVEYGRRLLNSFEVSDVNLKQGKYVQVPLAFRSPTGKLECRVFWRGNVSLRIDKVLLYRIEGARIDQFIHRAPQPKPSGEPKDLIYRAEHRPFPEIFPRSNLPSQHLLVADIRQLPFDWQFAIVALQGLVNRTKPQVYLLFNETDRLWLDWLVKRGWVKTTETVSDPSDLLKRFRKFVKGMVIYDPLLPATKNVATMVCSIEDAIPVSPRLAKQLNLPVIADLRERWRTNAEAYEWAFNNLLGTGDEGRGTGKPKLNRHVIACAYPDHIGMRDYFVQHRIFIFWISGPIDGARKGGDPDTEVRLMERIFAQLPVNIPVMSYPWAGQDVGIGEGAGVTLFSEFGKYLVGTINCSNLSVHSGIKIPNLTQPKAPPTPPLQLDKVYYSIIISDGDNLPVLTIHNFPQLWGSSVRGKLPLGWTISPSSIMLIPAIVDYYYATATTSDCFLGAVSGIGYCYPDHYGKRFRELDRQRVFDEFLAQTATYMQKMDLRELWIMGVNQPQFIRRYAEKIPNLTALFVDYGRRLSDPAEVTYLTSRNVAVFHAVTGWREEDSREERISRMVNEIRSMTPATRPAFLHVFVWNWGFDLEMLQEVSKRLSNEYVPVRPDHLAQLYQQWSEQQKLLIRTPARIMALEGQPIAFTINVSNVEKRGVNVSISVTGGMKDAKVSPARKRLGAGEGSKFRIVGIPAESEVRLRVKSETAAQEVEIPLERLLRNELVEPLPNG